MVATTRLGSFQESFATLPDPRVVGRTRHKLLDVVLIAICGVIANCDDWLDIAQFAENHESWLRRFLELPNGLPSHDTFERIFAALDQRTFERCCLSWLRAAAERLQIGHIAIDGKTLRGSASSKLKGLHLVSAWATQAQLTLGQVAVDKKSNEITAIPQLLELLNLKGALVTLDAMGCQTAIAQQIVDGGGDYVLTVKGNQEHLRDDIQTTVTKALEGELPAGVVHEYLTTERGHGRVEERSYVIIEYVDDIRDKALWPKLTTVGMCRSERTSNGKTVSEVRYFIGSRKMSARKYAETLRNHWGIENNLHWQLDISFHEDDSRIQEPDKAQNYALLRKIALCLLKQHPRKDSIKRKRKAAAMDLEFLEEVLSGANKVEKI
jgi:predicted transposase YbfD/YdcC